MYTYLHIQGGQAVDWDFRNRLLQASKSSHNTKLEVARVLAGKYDSAALQVFYAPVSKETLYRGKRDLIMRKRQFRYEVYMNIICMDGGVD